MKTVQFYGDELLAEQDETGQRWVALRPICQALGVAWPPQRTRLLEDDRFNRNDIVTIGADGKQREMFCIPVDQVNGWLYTINANRVKASSREKLLRYQRECQEVLFRHFMPSGVIDPNTTFGELARHITEGVMRATEARFDEVKAELHRVTGELQGVNGELQGVKTAHLDLVREVDVLRGMCEIQWSEDEMARIQREIKLTSADLKMDGRAVCGKVRAGLDISKVYDKFSAKRVINFLRAMRGAGIRIVKEKEEEKD